MNRNHVIGEYGTVRNRNDYSGEAVKDTFNEVFLPDKAFNSLLRFVAENTTDSPGIDQAFSVHLRNGKYFITVKNYVGLVETNDGTTLEILPKIYNVKHKDEEGTISYCRSVLLKMLRCLRNSPFSQIDQAHLKTTHLPVFEIFITVFLDEVEGIVRRGIKHNYLSLRENKPSLKGKLLLKEQMSYNLVRKQLFFVEFDDFRADIPQNRILKAALEWLFPRTSLTKSRMRIRNYLALMDEVGKITNLEGEITAINGHSRLFNYYEQALKWAVIFLRGESFTSFKGKALNQAILFPMEQLFEAYVADVFRRTLVDWDVTSQDRQYHLVEKHNGEARFRLRPDLLITRHEKIIVGDTKWKVVDQTAISKNYLISQADMYQLYAYGKKYQCEGKEVRLLLIYPKNELFTKMLHFEYEHNLHIDVVPFDFEEPGIIHLPCFASNSYCCI